MDIAALAGVTIADPRRLEAHDLNVTWAGQIEVQRGYLLEHQCDAPSRFNEKAPSERACLGV